MHFVCVLSTVIFPADHYFITLFERTHLLVRKEVPFRDTLGYWSSTTFSPNTYSAWIVMFDGAYILSYYKTNFYHVRCVRG